MVYLPSCVTAFLPCPACPWPPFSSLMSPPPPPSLRFQSLLSLPPSLLSLFSLFDARAVVAGARARVVGLSPGVSACRGDAELRPVHDSLWGAGAIHTGACHCLHHYALHGMGGQRGHQVRHLTEGRGTGLESRCMHPSLFGGMWPNEGLTVGLSCIVGTRTTC